MLSVSLLTCVPEMGKLNRQKLAALVRVAPLNRGSGLFKGNTSPYPVLSATR